MRSRKLVLYSDQIPPLTDSLDRELLALTAKPRPRIGFIPSAGPAESFYLDRKEYYERMGADMVVCFELDQEYHPERLADLLACDAIHLSGGNTYYFLHWLRKRELLDTLRQYVADGGVLVGVSAGSILITPDIDTSALCYDQRMENDFDFVGLGLVNFVFLPHLGTVSTQEAMLDYSRQQPLPVYGCPDGSGIVVDGDQMRFHGPLWVAENGVLRAATPAG